MLYQYSSDALSDVFTHVITRISESDAKRHIVIVPDKFTLSTERSVLDTLRIKGTFNTEVMSFERLADVYADRVRCLTPESSLMLMRKVIDDVKDKFVCYTARSYNSIGFAHDMYAVVTAIRTSDVSVAEFMRASGELNGFMRKKAHDVAIVYDGYMRALSDYSDVTTRMEELTRIIPEIEGIAETEFYILEYFSFNAKQLNIIAQLIKNAYRVNVGLITSRSKPNSRIYPNRTAETLKAIAGTANSRYETSYAVSNTPEPFNTLKTQLFSYAYPRRQDAANKVKVYEAKDFNDEIRAVCRNIRRLVNGGARYKDVAIVCGDVEAYTPTIARLFKMYGVPYFIDKKARLTSTCIVRYILSVLRCTAYGFTRDDAVAYFKNPLSDTDTDFAEQIECALENRGVKYISERIKTGKEEIDAAIAKLIEKLKRITQVNGKTDTYGDFADVLLKFIEDENLIERNVKLFDRDVDPIHRTINAQAGEKLVSILETIKEFSGTLTFNAEDFLITLNSVFDASEISVLPQYSDSVYIGECKDSRYINVKAMFIIGAVDGNIPAESKDVGIISDKELTEYKAHDIVIEPCAKSRNMEERLFVQQLVLKPKDLLFVSYPITDNQGKNTFPSVLIREITKLLYNDGEGNEFRITTSENENIYENDTVRKLVERISTVDGGFYEYADFLGDASADAQGKYCEYATLRAILYNSDAARLERIETEIADKESIERELYSGETVSASRLQTYFRCPYKHFLQYNLNAKRTDKGEMDVLGTGAFLHSVAELFVKERATVKDREELTKRIFDKVYDEQFKDVEIDGHTGVLINRLKKEALRFTRLIDKQMKASEFVNKKTEYGFDTVKDGKFIYKDIPVSFKGKIDRLDICGDKFIVLDYKSGSVHDKLYELYYGTALQPYLYMQVVKSKLGLKPAAVLYFKVKDEYSKNEDDKILYGQILNDADTVSKLDKTVNEDKPSEITGLYIKDGNYAPAKDLISEDDFTKYGEYVIALTDKALNEMKDGYAARKTYCESNYSICDNCDYKELCGGHNVKVRVRKQSATLINDNFVSCNVNKENNDG